MRGKLILSYILLCLLVTSGTAQFALSANYYIRSGAAGNNTGTDWINAWKQLPNILQRGATYYIASGDYPSYIFDDQENGNEYILIKKATDQYHGTDIGWKTIYGTNPALFKHITFKTGYYIFDGVTGGGSKNWKSGHGFIIFDTTDYKMIRIENQAGHIEIRHVEASPDTMEDVTDILYAIDNAGVGCDHITVSHCYFHDVYRTMMLIRYWTNFTLEYSCFEKNKSTPEIHGEPISTHGGFNFIIRYNVFEDSEGTGVIVNLSTPASDWKVYGNIFFRCESMWGCIGGTNLGTVMENIQFHNNTIVDFIGRPGVLCLEGGSGNFAYNNLYVNSDEIYYWNCTYDYNTRYNAKYGGTMSVPLNDEFYFQGDPFVDLENSNFRLDHATYKGKDDLGSPFNRDMDGKKRGSDNNWDRGAFEYGIGSEIISSPKNIRIKQTL